MAENRERFSAIPENEYVQHIKFVLERTENNIRKIKKKEDDREL